MNRQTSLNVAEQNKELQRYVVEEIWNNGDWEKINEISADDFVIHFPTPGEDLRGPEEIKKFLAYTRSAFPDIKFKVVDQIAEGDKVVTRWTAEGTHKGEFNGVPPTGKKVRINAIDIDRIVDGKFVECWTIMDEINLMQQISS